MAVPAVIENSIRFGKVYGILAELGDVEEKFRVALETSAGGYLSAIVVQDDNVARSAIEFLRENRLGYATFLPLNKISHYNYNFDESVFNIAGVYGLASELIKHSSKFNEVFSFVFKQTLVVKDLSVARKVGIGVCRMVTLEGDLVEKTGVMRGGYRQKRRNDVGFDRKLFLGKDGVAEIKTILEDKKIKLAEIDSRLEQIRIEIFENEKDTESINEKLETLNQEQKSILQESASLGQDLKLIDSNPAERNQILKNLNKEKEDLNKQIKEKNKEVVILEEKISKLNEEEEKKKQKVFELQDKMQTVQNTVNQTMADRNDLRVQIARLETKQDSICDEARIEMNVSVENIIERGIELTTQDRLEELNGKIQKLKYQLSLIGGIDEEVLEEYKQTKDKYDFLNNQLDDLQLAMSNLGEMLIELDTLMKKKSAKAFKEIRKEFKRYIKVLFDGGESDMSEIYGFEEELEVLEEDEQSDKENKRRKKIVTGIDIAVSPPGKKIRDINSLSGGERTLSSIALICAVLSYNPSPFVVLDEVEAALDESNTSRFSKIVSELSQRSQFIIITHNRVTMHCADALYGVTMGIDGMSKLLSVKLNGEK